jgi:uncharacterized protein (TIGR03435 family)
MKTIASFTLAAALCFAQSAASTLKALIATAWNVKPFQIAGGPAWLSAERWNVAPDRALLTRRFRLAVHREIRQGPVFDLTAAKDGLNLTAAGCGSTCGSIDARRGRIDAAGVHMAELARALEGILDRPVIDKTGFAGSFDAHFDYLPDDAVDATGPDASIFVVLEERFGLKLESGRGPMEMLIIDRAERP